MLSRLATALLFLVAFSGATLQAHASNVTKYVIPYAACCIDDVRTVKFFTCSLEDCDLITSIPLCLPDDQKLKDKFCKDLKALHGCKGEKNVIHLRVKKDNGVKMTKDFDVIFVRVPCDCTKDDDGKYLQQLDWFTDLVDPFPADKLSAIDATIRDKVECSWKTAAELAEVAPISDPKWSKAIKGFVAPLMSNEVFTNADVQSTIADIAATFQDGKPCCKLDLACDCETDYLDALCAILNYLNKCPGGTFDLKGEMETDDDGIVCATYKGDVCLIHEIIVCCTKWKLTQWNDSSADNADASNWWGVFVPALVAVYQPVKVRNADGTVKFIKTRGSLKDLLGFALRDKKLSTECLEGNKIRITLQAMDANGGAMVVTHTFQLENLGPLNVDLSASKKK